MKKNRLTKDQLAAIRKRLVAKVRDKTITLDEKIQLFHATEALQRRNRPKDPEERRDWDEIERDLKPQLDQYLQELLDAKAKAG